MPLDETLNDAMDLIWDDSIESLGAVGENIKQAKDKLDEAIEGKFSDLVYKSDVEAASKQLGTALFLLKEFLEPMKEDEEEPKPVKKPAAKKKKVK